jgi:hypothetical protein
MKRRTVLKLGGGTAMGAALAACGGNDTAPGTGDRPGAPPGNTVAGWTEAALQAVRSARPGPPMAARSFAIMYTCMYNAWCAYDALARPTAVGQGARRPPAEHTAANKATAMSYAAHAALVDQYPGEKAAFDAYLKQRGHDSAPARAAAGAPDGIGTAMARAELAYCHLDGANQLGDLAPGAPPYADYTGYAPHNPPMIVGAPTPRELIRAPGAWQPLTYTDPAGVVRTPGYLGAAWGRVRPFALARGDQFRPGPPAAAGSSEYLQQARHIVALQQGLDDEQKVIAEYWADGPGSELPPGLWLQFGLYVSRRDRHTDDDDIKLFFALSNALADAAIAAWDAKRAYDSARPITVVRYLMHGQAISGYGLLGPAGGLRTIQGEAWVPYQSLSFPTPPFPEHVSGHSAFSAAAAEVLLGFTGSDAFGASHTGAARSMAIEPGLPAQDIRLAWATFSAAASQAGMSRLYGGIHFERGNAAGLALGRQVGAVALARAQAMWQGKA